LARPGGDGTLPVPDAPAWRLDLAAAGTSSAGTSSEGTSSPGPSFGGTSSAGTAAGGTLRHAAPGERQQGGIDAVTGVGLGELADAHRLQRGVEERRVQAEAVGLLVMAVRQRDLGEH
ncbi:hypothetical protein VM98_35510, partial [Streptomyces rubellomurinus subsp. indigoferus]